MRIKSVVFNILASLGSLMFVTPTWIGAVLPSVVGTRAAVAQPKTERQATGVWNASWGTRVIGCAAQSATPVFTLKQADADTGRAVESSQGVPDVLANVTTMYELARVALPAQTYNTSFDLKDAATGRNASISLGVVSDVVGFQAQDPRGASRFVWGVHTHGTTTTISEGDRNAVTQYVDYFFVYGMTVSAETAKIAAASAGAVIALQVAAAPSCYSACMAAEAARHFTNLTNCLTAGGVGGGAGALVCVTGCLGSGPGYPACVTACLAAVGVTVGIISAACVAAYCAAMLGAAIGCAIGCWTCW